MRAFGRAPAATMIVALLVLTVVAASVAVAVLWGGSVPTVDGMGDRAASPASTALQTTRAESAGDNVVRRLSGSNRLETAVAASIDAFGDGAASAVVLARHDDFPDALAGTPLAVALDAPLLLTTRDRLHEATAAEISRVLPEGAPVVVLGGTGAIAATVDDQLAEMGYAPERIRGANRFETAVAIADAVAETMTVESVLLTRADTFPDALAAGAAAPAASGVVLLTAGASPNAATDAWLTRHPAVKRYAVGGPAARAYPGATAIAGSGREQTAILVAQEFFDAPALVGVARRDDFPDALAGGVHVGARGGPVLLTASDRLSDPVGTYLRANAESIDQADVYGGTAAVSDAVLSEVGAAITADGTVGAAGPRSLPATFVPLEIERFPRPADESCVDNTSVVRVTSAAALAGAIDDATPGTTVLVAPGTYTVNPEEYVALAWSTDNVCLRGEGGQAVIQAADGQSYGLETTGNDTVIDRITLRGFEAGISLGRDGGDTQQRVTIQRTIVEAMIGGFRDGIVAYGDNRQEPGSPPVLDGLLLLDVTVDSADLAVSCNSGPCAHWWLDRTKIHARADGDDTGADAFAVEEGRQIVVVDSTISGASGDGIDAKATDVVVSATRVFDVERNGIKLWHGGDVINTVVDGTGADAALVGENAARYRYVHVLVTHHAVGDFGYVGTWGYDAGDPVRLEIVNSILSDNSAGGLFVADGSQVTLQSTLMDAPGDSKLLEVDGTEYLVDDFDDLESDGYGADNVVGDPDFVDVAGRDYRTTDASPARDAAIEIDGLDRDIDGNPRSIGDGPDIGPVESGAG